ncbi:MAG TPA: glycogen synthase [Polyangiaceae bacterium]|nr:glycogen synthase [Polyangiaceae bacterium]
MTVPGRADAAKSKIALVSREYPPEVYGGAGVHVEYLARELSKLSELSVHCFGAERDLSGVTAHPSWPRLAGDAPHLAALRTLATDLSIAKDLEGVDLVHTHTWYANFAGHLAKLLYGAVHVMTTHSLEPLRPWKAEQLGGGYQLSSFCERIAIENADHVIAVSAGMKRDILAAYPAVDADRVSVIFNGIDLGEYQHAPDPSVLARHGIDPAAPYAIFVGRITRQKGIVHLLRAAESLPKQIGLVLCAGQPDTPELAAEVRQRYEALRAQRDNIVWIEQMLPRKELIALLSSARAFVCPSVYEPFGIVNLEAMACKVPVVASAVGGIVEIVVPGQTGELVAFEPRNSDSEPKDPERFARDLASAVAKVCSDPDLARRYGAAGRARVEAAFSWTEIAKTTLACYQRLLQ